MIFYIYAFIFIRVIFESEVRLCAICDLFAKNLFNFVNENLIDELSKHIMNLKPERGYDGLLERIKEDVIALRNTVEKRNLDISETKKTIDKIDSFIALLERLKKRFITANQ